MSNSGGWSEKLAGTHIDHRFPDRPVAKLDNIDQARAWIESLSPLSNIIAVRHTLEYGRPYSDPKNDSLTSNTVGMWMKITTSLRMKKSNIGLNT